MKELQSAVRQYQHNDCSGLVMGYDRIETELVVSNLLRERNELAAQVERLRGVIEHCVSAVEDTHYGWEGDCGVINKVNVIADSVLDETPAQSLEAVKREAAICALEDYEAALSSFEMTVPEYIKARLS